MTIKRLHQNSITGQQGVNLIERVVLEMGFAWYPTGHLETGIDGIIEIRDAATGETTNSIIQVQSRATKGTFQPEKVDRLEYLCEARDLDYWMRGNAPVILVVSRPDTNEAYWVSIKDYFKDQERRKTRKIYFDKHRDRFDATCKATLMALAIPKDAGVYFAPPPKNETLYSNLLKVSAFPDHIYIAETEYRSPKAVWAEIGNIGAHVGGEWILKFKSILSFRNLEEYPWDKICNPDSVKPVDTKEWAHSDDPDKRRDFVQLLNRCLRDKAWQLDLRYSERRECYYFRATEDLSPRTIRYQSIVKETPRVVFRGYPNKRDPAKIAYYRHSAFGGKFVQHGGAWCLEITPTYYFTWDGSRPDRYYEDRLKLIKQCEKNRAVLGQVIMWADYLGKKHDLFKPQYPFLEFSELITFDTDFGIHDELWLPREEEEVQRELSSDEPELFDK